jgi:hypothetical protein
MMAALVQTYPTQQSSAPVSLMQPRSQASHGTTQGPSQPARYNNNNNNNNNSGTRYQGYSTAPVAPYAFTSTPGLANSKSPSPSGSKPGAPAGRPEDIRQGYTSLDSISPDSNLRAPSSHSSARSMDDSPIRSNNTRPLLSAIQTASQPLPSPTREKPDRYKRVNRNSQLGLPAGSAQPSGSGMAAVAAVYTQPNRASSTPSLPHGGNVGQGAVNAPFIGDYTGQLRSQSVDDFYAYRRPSASAQGRRRSIGPGSMTAENFQNFLRQELSSNGSADGDAGLKPLHRPGSRRTGSTDSSASGSSSRASVSSSFPSHCNCSYLTVLEE